MLQGKYTINVESENGLTTSLVSLYEYVECMCLCMHDMYVRMYVLVRLSVLCFVDHLYHYHK